VTGKGGQSAFTFAPAEDLAANEELRPWLDLYVSRIRNRIKRDHVPGLAPQEKLRYPWDYNQTPGANWGPFAATLPYTTRGMLWWQGENDIALNEHCEPLFRQVIRSMRAGDGRGDRLPFIYIQLPTYMGGLRVTEWPATTRRLGIAGVRDAQRRLLTEPNTAMVVTVDLPGGGGIHPTNKAEIAERLLQTVRGMVYDGDTTYMGPIFKGATFRGQNAVLTFDHVGDGLKAEGEGSLLGFQAAGEDRNFVDAEARITGKGEVTVTASGPGPITSVRYAWHENPPNNLVNSLHLPASPFRTDDWPLFD
jgi:sialate O-acetylesterase